MPLVLVAVVVLLVELIRGQHLRLPRGLAAYDGPGVIKGVLVELELFGLEIRHGDTRLAGGAFEQLRLEASSLQRSQENVQGVVSQGLIH